ncbi:hypothetical protein [Flammeovirga sp. SJP92]|uniref:hypothetical protein n=1 Tax=Flammeovirga sp. SJP92 TaxID=1775430 RepID=UPI0012FC994C|nr:hypothetical protein [Flammeovirga sp. SJP92]
MMKKRLAFWIHILALIILVLIAKLSKLKNDNNIQSIVKYGNTHNKWVLPKVSEILKQSRFEETGPIDNYGWPGNPKKGFCADALKIAVRHASELRGIKLSGVNINGEMSIDQINIYFFDPDQFSEARNFEGNCTYTAFSNTIICDQSFLYQFQDIDFIEKHLKDYLLKEEELEDLLTNPRGDLRITIGMPSLISAHHVLIWALLHEIGHFAYDHKPISKFESLLAPETANQKSREMEKEADEFALTVLKESSKGTLTSVYIGLQNILAEQIALAVGAPGSKLPVQLYEFKDDIPLKQPIGTHPPLLIRCLNALIVFEPEIPNYLVKGSVYKKLKEQIKYIK